MSEESKNNKIVRTLKDSYSQVICWIQKVNLVKEYLEKMDGFIHQLLVTQMIEVDT